MIDRFDKQRTVDVICMGRVAVDLYAEQIGANLDEATSFKRYLGGCAGNISVGCSRLGLRSSLLSCTGDDDMGLFIRKQLSKENVDQRLMSIVPNHLTGLVLLGVNPPDRFPLMFYRENCADMQISKNQCQEAVFANTKALVLTGNCLSTVQMRAVSDHALTCAKRSKTAIVLDIDYRPTLWGLMPKGDGETRYKASEQVSKYYQHVLPYCDLIVGTQEEICIAGGQDDVQTALRRIRELTAGLIVVKTGSAGCEMYPSAIDQPVSIEGYEVSVLNVLGAGDAFISGFLRGWLRGQSLLTCATYANACGAIAVSRHGCSPAMPSYEEMREFIAQYDDGINTSGWTKINQLHRHVGRGFDPDQPLYILAFDHRLQFESSCFVNAVKEVKIRQFKQHVYKGFLQVAKQQPFAAMLLDTTYGQEILNDANQQSMMIGVPIEMAGSLPVRWLGGKSLYQTLLSQPAHWFVKVMWHFHPDMDYAIRQQQLNQLSHLHQVCCQLGRQWMLEFVVPDEYSANALDVVTTIRRVYQNGIQPTWWKLAALTNRNDWLSVQSEILQNDSQARVILMGGQCKALECYQSRFSAAKDIDCVSGFAIGRSIFWQPWQDWCDDKISLQDVEMQVAANYQAFIDLWQKQQRVVNKDKSYVNA